jgi:hypothetical protein
MVEIPLSAGRHKSPRTAQQRPDGMNREAVRSDQTGRLKRWPQLRQQLLART